MQALAPPLPFAVFYQEHAAYIRSVVRRVLNHGPEADDVVQDVFVQAWQQADRFDPNRGEVRAWLCNIARSRAIDRLRHRKVRLGTDLAGRIPAPPGDADPCHAAALAESAVRVSSAWATLPPSTQLVLELAYFENMPQREIASVVGETLGVVKSRIKQGLQALRIAVTTSGQKLEVGPECEVALTTTREHRPAGELPSLRGMSVMMVDDDPRTREVVEGLLRRCGAVAIVCSSGSAALAALETARPDVLLADLNMPGMDGFSLIRAVRRMHPPFCTVPAIAFTGCAGEADRACALLAGFQMHMSKPVHPLAVLAAIRKLTGAEAAACQ